MGVREQVGEPASERFEKPSRPRRLSKAVQANRTPFWSSKARSKSASDPEERWSSEERVEQVSLPVREEHEQHEKRDHVHRSASAYDTSMRRSGRLRTGASGCAAITMPLQPHESIG